MQKLILALAASLIAQHAQAHDGNAASRIVQKYSEAIACELSEKAPNALLVQQGDPEFQGVGSVYLVHWRGDVGCSGGYASVTDNFSVVVRRGLYSVHTIVTDDFAFPKLPLAIVTGMTIENGVIKIEGLNWKADDPYHQPSQPVLYRIKFDGAAFMLE